MTVISITITESPMQKMAGIPSSVAMTTNVPATIFYTLDGTEPTIDSLVYVAPIDMPMDEGTVILKAYATDGVSQSATITNTYGTTIVGDRRPRDTVSGIEPLPHGATFPFGDSTPAGIVGVYGNTGGVIVDNPLKPEIPDGFDGDADGTPAGYTNEPAYTYENIFSETNSIGMRGKGIGTLPANVTIIRPSPTSPEGTDASSALFNPKALVVYQDSSEPQYDPDVPNLQRSFFSLTNPERARDGNALQTTGGPAPTGSSLRTQYNPTDNTMTFYYYDNRTGRWIISKEKFRPKDPDMGNYAGMVFSSRLRAGPAFIFKWIPFQYHRLIT
jgi:hypothetical protein